MTKKYQELIDAMQLYSIEERKEIVAAIQATYDPKMEVIELLNSFKLGHPTIRAYISHKYVAMSIALMKLRHIPLFEDFEFKTTIGEFYDRFPENYPWYRSGHYYTQKWNEYVNHLIKIVQAGRCLRKQLVVTSVHIGSCIAL